MKTQKPAFPKLAVVITLLFLFCTKSPISNNGTGSTTETAKVSASLSNPGGSPAVHAKVRFCHHNHQPNSNTPAFVDSAITDTNGNYTVALDSGTYTILAASDSGVAFIDSIVAIKDSTITPPRDTLRPAGSLIGKVQLEPGDDPRTVFVLFMGTNVYTNVDDIAGNFSTPKMAEGKYRVRLLTTLDAYEVMDTVLSIAAGKDSVMVNPIRLKYKGIPVPKNVRIEYDTAMQIVSLIWGKEDTGKVKGFYVYRRNVDSNTVLTRINTNPVSDTLYHDSTGIQDQTYEYRVAVVDKNSTEGTKSAGVSVKVVGAFVLDRAFNGLSAGQGQFNQPMDMAIDHRNFLYVADQGAAKILIFNENLNFIREFNTGVLTSPSKIDVDTIGNIYVVSWNAQDRIVVFDSLGTEKDSIVFGQSVYDFSILENKIFVLLGGNGGGDSIVEIGFNGIGIHSWGRSDIISPANFIGTGDSKTVSFADDGNHKVQILDSVGNIRTMATTIDLDITGIAANDTGHLVILNKGNDLLAFDLWGKLLAKNSLAIYMNNHGEAYALCVSRQSNSLIYVLHRNGILKFSFILP